jgi:hypothetical protein
MYLINETVVVFASLFSAPPLSPTSSKLTRSSGKKNSRTGLLCIIMGDLINDTQGGRQLLE